MLALRSLVLLAAVVCLAHWAHAYGTGAPKEACGDMIPQHHTPPQNSPSPYNVLVKQVKQGVVQVTIKAKTGNSKKFMGFMVQGRVGNTPVGKFIDPPANVRLVDCGDGVGTAATHADKNVKDTVTLTWKAPPNLKERVVFLATVAEDGGHFWVGTPSKALLLN